MMENKHMNDSELENVAGGAASQDKFYTVKEGDCLSTIAHKHNTTTVKLILLNPQIKDPNLIHPGDIIRLCL
jgi:nucleoid-associated protein YgaU